MTRLEQMINKYEDAREIMKRNRCRDDEMMVVNTIIEDLHSIRKEKPKVNEIIIGMTKDPQFGPLIMFGTGGIYANFMKDVSFALSYKFSENSAKKLIENTKTYSLLQGVRGDCMEIMAEI